MPSILQKQKLIYLGQSRVFHKNEQRSKNHLSMILALIFVYVGCFKIFL